VLRLSVGLSSALRKSETCFETGLSHSQNWSADGALFRDAMILCRATLQRLREKIDRFHPRL